MFAKPFIIVSVFTLCVCENIENVYLNDTVLANLHDDLINLNFIPNHSSLGKINRKAKEHDINKRDVNKTDDRLDTSYNNQDDLLVMNATVQLNKDVHENDNESNSELEVMDNLTTEFYNSNNLTMDICVGDPEFCNMTKEEYLIMLYDYIYPQAYEWVLIATHAIVFVIGLIGNALVCIAVYRNHSMRTVTNYFIVNLAVADFMVILICLPPTVLWDVTETWFFGTAMCRIVLYFQVRYMPLHLACSMHSAAESRLHTAHVLLEHAGADVWRLDVKGGDTAIHLAVNSHHCDLHLVMVLFHHFERNEWKGLAQAQNRSSVSARDYARAASRSTSRPNYPLEVLEFLKKCR